MPGFGARSKSRLSTLHPDLVAVLKDVIPHFDFTVVSGHRTQAAQDEAFASGKSKKQWPDSKHNKLPSIAVDVAPWPIDWTDHLAFARLYGRIEQAAAARGIHIRWGGDWDGDQSSRDQSFMDIGHLELVV